VRADAAILRDLLGAGWLPVVSPLARDGDDATGSGLNVNGDDAAAAIAVALGARELLFVADVAGVLVDGKVVPSLTVDDAAAMIGQGIAAGGMAAKLEAGRTALSHGVECIRISDLAALGDPARGTTLVRSSVTSPSPTVAQWPR
jgi:acetylglutamate kinase